MTEIKNSREEPTEESEAIKYRGGHETDEDNAQILNFNGRKGRGHRRQ